MTCSTCGRRCSSWWELLHGHDCHPIVGIGEDDEDDDLDLTGDDYLADEQDAAYEQWKEGRDV